MSEIEIQSKNNWLWVKLSAFLAAASLVFGIWKGPTWPYVLSGVGLTAFLVGLAISLRHASRDASDRWMAAAVACFHLLCLGSALVASQLFLAPLSDSSLNLPSFRRI